MQELYKVNFKTLMKHPKELCKWNTYHVLDKKDLKQTISVFLIKKFNIPIKIQKFFIKVFFKQVDPIVYVGKINSHKNSGKEK